MSYESEEKVFGPNWQSVSGFGSGSYDAFGSKKEPSKWELVKAFSDIPYACARLIAQKVSNASVKLFVKTTPGQQRPKCATRPVTPKSYLRLSKEKRLTIGTQVEEVLEHPALDILYKCNSYHNYNELAELTDLFLSITGNAFWFVRKDQFGVPLETYLLPSQYVSPIRDDSMVITGWRFGEGTGEKQYSTDDVIHFRLPSLLDPYGEGIPPMRAAWQRLQIAAKELAYIDSTLTNQGRPDVVISPADKDMPIHPDQAERLAKDWSQRFRADGNGGPFIASDPLNITPLNWSPRDLWELQVYREVKTAICNDFLIPPDLFELGVNSNRSTREAAIYSLAEDCIKPRVATFVAKLNERLLGMYGEDRLFFDCENVVPDDKEFELKELQLLLSTGCITRQEARIRYGFVPEQWAAEPLLPPGSLPALTSADDQAEEPEPMPVDRSAQAPAVAALQQSYYAGQLPREAATANARLLFGFTPEEAEALFPAIPPVKLTPDDPAEAPAPEAPPPPPPQEAPEKAPQAPPGDEQKAYRTKALPVPETLQQGVYDCGAASTLAVARFFNVGPDDEADFIEELGTSPEQGTAPEAIASCLEALGLVVQAKAELTIDDLSALTSAGSPVIVCVQDYEEKPEDIPAEVAGHYVVITAADDDNVSMMDPAAGNVDMPTYDFLARWEDRSQTEEYVHFGIAVSRPQGKAIRKKAIRRKSPVPFAQALASFFRKQAGAIQTKVKAVDDIHTKALPEDWFDLSHWTQEMYQELRPIVATYFDYSAKETVSRIGGSPSLFATVQPKLKEGVDKATMLFCEETNKTTRLEINEAIARLRQEITEGLIEGDVKNEQMKRVQSVFEDAENVRAWRIAVTEASRGQHAAQEITAVESGIVKGKRWILSSEACPECQPMANKVVPLGENFTVRGEGPYSDIPFPPLHPHCRCDLIEVIEGVND